MKYAVISLEFILWEFIVVQSLYEMFMQLFSVKYYADIDIHHTDRL